MVSVSGEDTELSVGTISQIYGNSVLNISGGATVTSTGQARISQRNSNFTIAISDTGSSLVASSYRFADRPTRGKHATVLVSNGGEIEATGNYGWQHVGDSSVTTVLSGTNSALTSASLYIGGRGTSIDMRRGPALLSVNDGATATAVSVADRQSRGDLRAVPGIQ